MRLAPEVILTKEDLGPKRRAFDRVVYYGMAMAIGWFACSWFYNTPALVGLVANSYSWTEATSDRFATLCTEHYGPQKFPDLP